MNTSSMANDLGISHHTVKEWLSILEASYIMFELQPYYENLGKRLTKSSKFILSIQVLACFLLDIEDPQQLNRDPLRGSLFENMIIG